MAVLQVELELRPGEEILVDPDLSVPEQTGIISDCNKMSGS